MSKAWGDFVALMALVERVKRTAANAIPAWKRLRDGDLHPFMTEFTEANAKMADFHSEATPEAIHEILSEYQRAVDHSAERLVALTKDQQELSVMLRCKPDNESIQAEIIKLQLEAGRPALLASSLRELCGYVEDGSNCTLKIFQDDATRTWHVKSDVAEGWADSLIDAIGDAYSKVD